MRLPAPRRMVLTVALTLPAALLPVVAAPPALAVSPDIVVSQVYGGGGNTGAPFDRDYVELYNRGTQPVDLTGWSVQYASASGTGTFAANAPTELGGTLPPGSHYLVALASGTTGAPLPDPDAEGTSNLGGSAGKVAVVRPGSPLGLACNGGSDPCDAAETARIADLVGYGSSATYFETAPAPAPSNTTALFRAAAGATDTDNNSADFAVGAPAPRSLGDGPPTTGCDVAPTHQVAAVQGTGFSTPLPGQAVRVEGVVTGDFQQSGGFGGFFLQDDTPDEDPLSSEGLFVLSSSPAAPGDRVRVSGTVVESFGRTQLSNAVVDVCGTGVIAPTTYDLPRPVGVTFEHVESMLVTFPETLTATEHFQLGRFGEVTVSSDGRLRQPTDVAAPGAPAQALLDEASRRRLLIDDGSNLQNPAAVPYLEPEAVRVGDTTSGVTGVLDFAFNQFRLQPTAPITFARTNPRPAAPAEVGGDVKVASFNTLNYFTTLGQDNPDARGADTPTEFTRQQAKEVAAITGLDSDVIGLMEVENNGSTAIGSLVDALNAATAAGTYAAITEPDLNPPNAFGGTFGTDAIKVALIYRPAAVTPVGPAHSSADPVFDRPPLIQTFAPVGGGESFTVAVNHFKSKSCDAGSDPLDQDQGDGQACFNHRRVLQAQALDDVLDTLAPPNPLIVGDLNSYTEEDPIHVLEAEGYTGLSEEFVAEASRYSFVFDGFSGELDHAMAGAEVLDNVTGATIWHINADEPLILDYNTEFNPPGLFQPDAFRSSDHDPLIVGLSLDANTAPTVDAGGPYTVGEGDSVTLTASGSDPDGDTLEYAWDLDGNGSFETPGQSVTFAAGGRQAPSTADVSVRVTDPEGLTGTDASTVHVVFDADGGLAPPLKEPPAVNTVFAGLVVPVRVKLGGFQGNDILAAGSPTSTQVSCATWLPLGAPERARSLFNTGLNYHKPSRSYAFLWTTKGSWRGTCRQFEMTFVDGTTVLANIRFR